MESTLEPLEQELRLDFELTLEFLEPMLELLDRLVLMLELLDRLERLLMESLVHAKLTKGEPMELVLLLVSGDFSAIALARVPVSPPGITAGTIARSAAAPVASSTITFIISFTMMMMMRSLFTTAAAAMVVLVALVLV